jgi:hypothetical protein
MLGRTRSVVTGALLALAVAAPAAQAAVPDQWTRWANVPRDTTIRSLDWAGALYAASESDGVYWSANPFGPWSDMNDGLTAPAADDVRQVKAGPNGLVYAATSAGLYAAQPAGAWKQVGGGTGTDKLNMGGIQSIMFNDPSGSDMTVAVAGAAGAGVWNSANGGATWKRASGMPAVQSVYHLTSHPAGTPMYAAADDGVWISLDFGRNWTLMADGIPPGETTLRVAVSPVDPTRLYATTSSSVYRFKPQKLAWEEIDGQDDDYLPSGAKKGFLVTPPLNGNFGDKRMITATRSGVYATIDDGDHWREMSKSTLALPGEQPRPMDDEDVWTLAPGISTPTLLAGTGYGVFTLPLQPLEFASVTINEPAGGMVPGKTLTTTLNGVGGSRPYWFTYQWFRCQFDIPGCMPDQKVDGATGSSFTIPADDKNKSYVKYRVTVTGRNIVHPTKIDRTDDTTAGVGGLDTDTPQPKYPSLPGMTPGINQVPTPVFGQVYTLSNGSWQSSDVPFPVNITPAFSYKWLRCDGSDCAEIPGETGISYETTAADIGMKVAGYVRATNGGFSSDWYLGGTSNTVVNMHPKLTVAPKVLGEPYVGRTLSSSAGGWDGHDMTFERRWFRCEADGLGCNPVYPEAKGATFKLTAADLGKRLAVEVTAVGADPKNVARKTTVLSKPSAVIANPPVPPAGGGPQPPAGGGGGPVLAPTVKIKVPRKRKVGAKLKVAKAFTGFSDVRYRWLRNGKKIKKATKRVYRITRRDRGKRISCRLTLTPAAGGAAIVVRTKPVKIPR